MAWFEPRTSGIVSDISANWATTTAHWSVNVGLAAGSNLSNTYLLEQKPDRHVHAKLNCLSLIELSCHSLKAFVFASLAAQNATKLRLSIIHEEEANRSSKNCRFYRIEKRFGVKNNRTKKRTIWKINDWAIPIQKVSNPLTCQPVRQDWAIFERPRWQICFHKCCPKFCNIWAYFDRCKLWVKTVVATFGQLW